MAATARRFFHLRGERPPLHMPGERGQQRQHRQQNQRQTRVLHGDHREDREDSARIRRHRDHAGGEQRLHGVHVAGEARGQLAGSCAESVAAGRRASALGHLARSAWVIFWPRISSSVSCAEASIPSSARLPKYSSAAANVSGIPPVRRSMTRQQQRRQQRGQHRRRRAEQRARAEQLVRRRRAADGGKHRITLHAPHLPSGFHTARDRPGRTRKAPRASPRLPFRPA